MQRCKDREEVGTGDVTSPRAGPVINPQANWEKTREEPYPRSCWLLNAAVVSPSPNTLQVLRASPSLCGRALRSPAAVMSRRQECSHGSSSDSSGDLALTCMCIGAAIWFFVAMLGQVFSWHGLLYSFGMADPTNLKYPVVVRALTFGLILELGVLVS